MWSDKLSANAKTLVSGVKVGGEPRCALQTGHWCTSLFQVGLNMNVNARQDPRVAKLVLENSAA